MLEQLQNVVVLASRTNCRLTSSAVSSGMRLPSEQRLAQQWFSTLAPNRSASHGHSTCVAWIPAPSTTAFHASPSTVGQRCKRNPAMTVCLALHRACRLNITAASVAPAAILPPGATVNIRLNAKLMFRMKASVCLLARPGV